MNTRKTPTLLLLCPLLAGMQPFPPGPTVVNGFATDVDVAIKLTDGTVRRRSFSPCERHRVFGTTFALDRRTVFVERLTVAQDGAVVGDYEGAKVEARGALGGAALFDESGLRRWTGGSCSRVFNTTGEVMRVTGHYQDGGTASVTLRPREPLLWISGDLARPKAIGKCRTRWSRGPCQPARRTVITLGGTVIHDLDARAMRKAFKRRDRTTFAIGESAITRCDRSSPLPSTPCSSGRQG